MLFVDPEQIDLNFYKQYEENKSSTLEYYVLSEPNDRRSFLERLKEIDRICPRKGEILEIGCSIGTFLKLAKADGWTVAGVEPNKPICSYLKKDGANLPVFNAFFDEKFVESHNQKYDVVYSSDVIEHVPNPVSFLAGCKKLLKKGGLVVIVTPDFDSMLTRLFQVKPKQHFVYLNRENIRKLFDIAGLGIIDVKNIHRYRSVRAMVNSTTFTDADNCGFLMPLVRIINMLKLNFAVEYVLDLFTEDLMIVAK